MLLSWVYKALHKTMGALAGVVNSTVTSWVAFLRDLASRTMAEVFGNGPCLGGPDRAVQADESMWFSLPKQNRGGKRPNQGNWMVVLIEEDEGNGFKFYAQLVRRRTRAVLEHIIYNTVKPGTLIKTDEHKGYYWLGRPTNAHDKLKQFYRPAIFQHRTVNHSKSFKADDGTHTNLVEGTNANLKSFYKSQHGLPHGSGC